MKTGTHGGGLRRRARYARRVEWFLVALLAALLFGTSLICLALLMARSRVQQRHRVDPAIPTDAPLSWLVDPRTPARLHRRLARVGTLATTVADDHQPRGRRRRRSEPSLLANTATDLRAQAVALDLQVSRLALLTPGARRAPMVEVHRRVADVEAAASRLIALSTQARAPRGLDSDDSTLAEITQRVDRLAQAQEELLAIDADARLVERPLPAPPLTSPASGLGRPRLNRPPSLSPSPAPAPASAPTEHR